MVANTVLPMDKPFLVFAVAMWLCDWVVVMFVFPNFLLKPFTVGIDLTSSKSFHWTCIQLYFMVVNTVLPKNNAISSKYWTVMPGKTNISLFYYIITTRSMAKVYKLHQTMKYLWQYVCWKVFHVSENDITQAYCCLLACLLITEVIASEKNTACSAC
jgi:hypothetical protein